MQDLVSVGPGGTRLLAELHEEEHAHATVYDDGEYFGGVPNRLSPRHEPRIGTPRDGPPIPSPHAHAGSV